MIITVLAILVIAAGLVPMLHRDLAIAVARQRRREWLRRNPQALDLQRRINAMHHQISVAFIPVMRDFVRAAADMEKTMAKITAAMRGDR